MITSLASRLRRAARIAALSAVVSTGAVALAQPAAAADYCVSPSLKCTPGTPKSDLQAALDEAAAQPDADRIFLGVGIYKATGSVGFVYNKPNSPVELIGVSDGATTVTSSAGAPQSILRVIGGPGTSIHDLGIDLPAGVATGAEGLDTNGTVEKVFVGDESPQANPRIGIRLEADGRVEDSHVLLSHASDSTGIFATGGASLRTTIADAQRAVQIAGAGSIDHSFLNGHEGVWVGDGQATIRETAITASGTGAIGIWVGAQDAAGTNVDAHNLTLDTTSASTTGIAGATTPVQADVEIKLTNSLIHGFSVPLDLYAFGAAAAKATSTYSNYNSSADHTSGANASISEAHVSYAANPLFSPSAPLRPMSASPLIDAGDPATPQGLDLDGNPLVTDGNLDGIARRDIGAFELHGPLPVPGAPSGGTTPPATGGDQPPSSGDGPPLTTDGGPARDTQAPQVSKFRSSRNAFAVGRARTAVAAVARGTTLRYTLSEPAKVTVTIRRDRARRATGRLTRSGRKGANRIKFSGRIGARALKPGHYTLVITAIDAAGNRSAAKSIGVRVVRAQR